MARKIVCLAPIITFLCFEKEPKVNDNSEVHRGLIIIILFIDAVRQMVEKRSNVI